MGKTHKGAVWLDAQKFSPYEYYQFWINSDDADVARFLALFTFLSMEEIEQIKNIQGADLNKAKVILAYEACKICHGEDEAGKALKASVSMFGSIEIPDNLLPGSSIPRGRHQRDNENSVPSSSYNKNDIIETMPLIDLFVDAGLCKSKSDVRRLIKQGGAYINGNKITGFDQKIIDDDIQNHEVLLRAGKKKYHKIILK
jgi:tyrosyl-tRNA synthetase